MPELRIDPLTGQRAIVAGDRAGRPGGELRGRRRAEPIDPETRPVRRGPRGPHAARALRGAARRRRARHAGLDGARGAEPVPGARAADAPSEPAAAAPTRDLFWAGAGRAARTR